MPLSREQLEKAFSRTTEQRERFAAGGGGGSFQNIIKLAGGYNRLRHIADANGLPFVYLRRQEKWVDNRPTMFLDLRFLFETEELLDRFRDRLGKDDYRLFQEFGDPWVAFFYAINDDESVPWEQKVHKWLLPKSVILYAVGYASKEGYEFGILSRGPTYHEELMKLVVGSETTDKDGNVITLEPKAPGLFDEATGQDVEVVGNNKPGLERRYDAPDPQPPSAVEVPDDERPDLMADVGRAVGGWAAKYTVLRKQFNDDTLEKYGLGPSKVEAFLRGPGDAADSGDS